MLDTDQPGSDFSPPIKPRCRATDRPTDQQTDKQRDIGTERQADRLTDRQTERQIDRQTDENKCRVAKTAGGRSVNRVVFFLQICQVEARDHYMC